jgi:hypothetical protein
MPVDGQSIVRMHMPPRQTHIVGNAIALAAKALKVRCPASPLDRTIFPKDTPR